MRENVLFVILGVFLHIGQDGRPPHLAHNFKRCFAFQRSPSALLHHRAGAVYYYSAGVILDAMCPYAKNNAPAVPRITHMVTVQTSPPPPAHVHPTCPTGDTGPV